MVGVDAVTTADDLPQKLPKTLKFLVSKHLIFKTFDWPNSQHILCEQATFGAANKYRFENLRCEILVNH